MEVNCSCSLDYDGYNEFESLNTPIARKRHRCCECESIIMPKERYERFSSKFDGDFFSYATCNTCAAIRRDYGRCAYMGDLRQAVRECLGVDYVTGEIDDE